MRLSYSILGAVLLALVPMTLSADEGDLPPSTAAASSSFWGLEVENDKVAGTDRHYTNGIRLNWLSAAQDVPDWAHRVAYYAPFIPDNGIKRWSLRIGHSIFTPADTEDEFPESDDRPYAGWLYGGVGFVSDTGGRLDNLELLVGIVGPSAHGETVQNDYHRLIGVEEAKGWDDYRLHDEPGVMLSYERKWRTWQNTGRRGFGFDVTPHVGVTLGNVMTHASGGLTLRLGHNLPNDYGPPRIRPSVPGTIFFVPPESGFGWYLFAGFEGRAVARNIFLDGNTWRDSPSVDKLPFVGDIQAGVALTFDRARIAFTHVLRSREFSTQEEPDRFGSLSLTLRF